MSTAESTVRAHHREEDHKKSRWCRDSILVGPRLNGSPTLLLLRRDKTVVDSPTGRYLTHPHDHMGTMDSMQVHHLTPPAEARMPMPPFRSWPIKFIINKIRRTWVNMERSNLHPKKKAGTQTRTFCLSCPGPTHRVADHKLVRVPLVPVSIRILLE